MQKSNETQIEEKNKEKSEKLSNVANETSADFIASTTAINFSVLQLTAIFADIFKSFTMPNDFRTFKFSYWN